MKKKEQIKLAEKLRNKLISECPDVSIFFANCLKFKNYKLKRKSDVLVSLDGEKLVKDNQAFIEPKNKEGIYYISNSIFLGKKVKTVKEKE